VTNEPSSYTWAFVDAAGGGEACGTLRRHGSTWTAFSTVERHVASVLGERGVTRCPHLVGKHPRRAFAVLSKYHPDPTTLPPWPYNSTTLTLQLYHPN